MPIPERSVRLEESFLLDESSNVDCYYSLELPTSNKRKVTEFSSYREPRKRARVTEEKATNVTEDVIKSSFAAKVTGGRTIKESSRCSGISYAYDVDSNKDGHLCALCLSVSENIQFKANNDSSKQELETIAKMMIKDMYENKAVALLKELEKVYEEETCVICMEDDKPPDVVFYQCGHQCCHGDCSTKLQTCPICRRNIAATIKVQPTI